MKRLVLCLVLLASPAMADPLQPITLSAQEYDAIIGALAQRDPIMAALIAKQHDAQGAAKARAASGPAPVQAAPTP